MQQYFHQCGEPRKSTCESRADEVLLDRRDADWMQLNQLHGGRVTPKNVNIIYVSVNQLTWARNGPYLLFVVHRRDDATDDVE